MAKCTKIEQTPATGLARDNVSPSALSSYQFDDPEGDMQLAVLAIPGISLVQPGCNPWIGDRYGELLWSCDCMSGH